MKFDWAHFVTKNYLEHKGNQIYSPRSWNTQINEKNKKYMIFGAFGVLPDCLESCVFGTVRL